MTSLIVISVPPIAKAIMAGAVLVLLMMGLHATSGLSKRHRRDQFTTKDRLVLWLRRNGLYDVSKRVYDSFEWTPQIRKHFGSIANERAVRQGQPESSGNSR